MKIFRLKEILDNKGMTGKELASRIGITEASVSNLVRGESIPRKKVLIDIARVLQVDIPSLFVPAFDRSFFDGDMDNANLTKEQISKLISFLQPQLSKGYKIISLSKINEVTVYYVLEKRDIDNGTFLVD